MKQEPNLAPGHLPDNGPPLLLSADGVTKSFNGVPALRNGVLKLRPGSVHALCGGNGAGKSTFLSILMGILQRDGGDIQVDGREVHFKNPRQALEAGISIITQELSPVKGMTVAENLYLGREPRRLGCFVNHGRLNAIAAELLDRLGFRIQPTSLMSSLSLAEMQLVEIAKALTHDSRILIMDEPTSAIGQHETELLFKAVRQLRSIGAGIIYVTHRMTEIFELADDYTVFRDGAFVESGAIRDIDRRHLIRQIIGRDAASQFRSVAPVTVKREDRPLLETRRYACGSKFGEVNLILHPGEVVGIYGLLGSGRSEFLQSLFGLEAGVKGELRMNGEAVRVRSPQDAMKQGMALVTEDRKGSGLVLPLSVTENIAMSSLGRWSTAGFVNRRQEAQGVQEMVEKFKIRAASVNLPVQYMSGGNQQKVVLGRWLQTRPRLLLLDEPTRGIDEGAKQEIYRFMTEFTSAGGAIIMVSSEVDEVLGMSDRVLVFRRGFPCRESRDGPLTREELVHLAA